MADDPRLRAAFVLEERARMLARPVETEDRDQGTEMLVVALAGELYCIEIHHVVEVLEAAPPTAVPGLPQFWAGVINVRGRLYPVLDLARYLEIGPVAGTGVLALVQAADLELALLVEDVVESRRVDVSEIRRPLARGIDARNRPIRGTTADLLSVLDLDALMSDPKLTVDSQLV